jgi:hypothetical protein
MACFALLGDRALLPPSRCGFFDALEPCWADAARLDASIGASGASEKPNYFFLGT